MRSVPSDGKRFLLMALGARWVMSFVYAFVAAATTPEQISESDVGLNRFGAFLEWQAVACIIAVAVFGVGIAWEKGSAVRRLTYLPVLLALILAAGVIGAAIWSQT